MNMRTKRRLRRARLWACQCRRSPICPRHLPLHLGLRSQNSIERRYNRRNRPYSDSLCTSSCREIAISPNSPQASLDHLQHHLKPYNQIQTSQQQCHFHAGPTMILNPNPAQQAPKRKMPLKPPHIQSSTTKSDPALLAAAYLKQRQPPALLLHYLQHYHKPYTSHLARL